MQLIRVKFSADRSFFFGVDQVFNLLWREDETSAED